MQSEGVSSEVLESGIFRGIASFLSKDDIKFFIESINQHRVYWSGIEISNPGSKLLNSLSKESYLYENSTDLKRFHGALKKLYQAFNSNDDDEISSYQRCCHWHSSRALAGSEMFKERDPYWIIPFFDCLSAMVADRSYLSAPSSLGANRRLSRFIELENFIDNYIENAPSNQSFITRLTPKIPKDLRLMNLQHLGNWDFEIGKYPNAELSEQRWCPNIYPFATLTSEVENFNRNESPCALLKNLGIPYFSGEHWIELIYRIDDAKINDDSVFIPLPLDCRGNWAYRFDIERNKNNYARNIKDDTRGMSEIIHGDIHAALIFDAIVWPQKTTSSWHESSKLVVS